MARVIELSCPNCNSSEHEVVGDGRHRCAYCGTVFAVEPERPAPAPTARAVSPHPAGAPAPSPKLVIAIALLGAVALGGVLAYSLMTKATGTRRGPTASRYATAEVPPVSRARVEAPTPPRATLRETAHARLARGSEIWIVTLANTGPVPIERPAVLVSLFDAAGRRVAERQGYAPIELLGPGQASPVLVLITDPPAYAKAEVQPSNIRAAGAHPPRLARVRVTEQTTRPYLSSHRKIVGTVRNEGPRTARFVRIVATGRDAVGKLVSFASGYATRRAIEPGGESGFELTSGTFDIRAPARFEVFAVGREQ